MKLEKKTSCTIYFSLNEGRILYSVASRLEDTTAAEKGIRKEGRAGGVSKHKYKYKYIYRRILVLSRERRRGRKRR